jgi:hypothetical protein
VDLHSSNAYFGIEPAAPTLASVVVDRGPGNLDATLPFPLPEPPDDHFTDDLGDGPYGAEIAIYSALAYVDEDGDGRWSGNVYTEGVIASSDAVEPSERITVLYMRATGFEAGLLADLFGGMGWTLFQDGETPDDSPIPVSWSDGLVLDDRWE